MKLWNRVVKAKVGSLNDASSALVDVHERNQKMLKSLALLLLLKAT